MAAIRTDGWRVRVLVVLTVLAALCATLVTPVEASPPIRDGGSGSSVDCPTDDGFVGVSLFDGGGDPSLDVFVATDEMFAFGFTQDVVVDGDSFSGVVELFDEFTGEVIGTATVDATVTATGPSQSFSDRFRQGNVLERFEDTFSDATVSGTVTFDGALAAVVDLADCTGTIFEFSFFVTQPATFVDRFQQRVLDCVIDDADVFGFLFAGDFDDGFGPFVDLFLDEYLGTAVAGFSEDAVFTDQVLQATLELFDVETGDVVGTATVDATLTSSGTFVDEVRTPREAFKVVVEEFAVEGTVTIGDAQYELTSCFAQFAEGRVRFTDPPRRARPVANDAPEDAILLPVPGGDDVDTSGAAEQPEAACTAVFEDEGELFEFDLPITHTVWYAFEGTGGPVTVDTAGSAIDTIVGVYDTDLAQLACVDDVFEEPDFFSLQAAVTVDTEPGVTYLVQVGGFGGDRGPVTVSID